MTGILERFAAIGSLPDDTDDERIRKGALTPAAGIICALAPVGVITYLLLDLPVSAAIPLADVVVSVTSLIVFSRTKRYRLFRTLQLALMLALPFALQWSLGGFVPSSDRGAVGADVSARRAHVRRHPSGGAVVRRVPGVDRRIARARTRLTPADIPEGVQVAFLAANVAGVSLTATCSSSTSFASASASNERSEALLLNVLPEPIAVRLKRHEGVIADRFEHATVLFADIVDFTPISAAIQPHEVVELLDGVFSDFDELAERHGLEKIKTIGDAYMVASGIPTPRPDHVRAVADMALEMLGVAAARREGLGLRIGIDRDPWSPASSAGASSSTTCGRHGQHRPQDGEPRRPRGDPGDGACRCALDGDYVLEYRGTVEIKGKGAMSTWFLRARADNDQDTPRGAWPGG